MLLPKKTKYRKVRKGKNDGVATRGNYIAFGDFALQSQENNDLKLSSLPYYSYGKGLGLTSPDSLFQLNIRFRMQNFIVHRNTRSN